MNMRALCLPLVVMSSLVATAQPRGPRTPSKATSGVYFTQEGYIDANGVMLYYVTLGRGEPLLILHGGPGASHDYFLPYLLPLARTHRLIFIDERGSGKSQQLQDTSRYTIEAMAEDAEERRVGLGR